MESSSGRSMSSIQISDKNDDDRERIAVENLVKSLERRLPLDSGQDLVNLAVLLRHWSRRWEFPDARIEVCNKCRYILHSRNCRWSGDTRGHDDLEHCRGGIFVYSAEKARLIIEDTLWPVTVGNATDRSQCRAIVSKSSGPAVWSAPMCGHQNGLPCLVYSCLPFTLNPLN